MRRTNGNRERVSPSSSEFRVADVVSVSPPQQAAPPAPPTQHPPAPPRVTSRQQSQRSSRLSTPSLTLSPLEDVGVAAMMDADSPETPSLTRKSPPVTIAPPTLRPQHVYAPVAPLGMLSLGVLSKHKKEGAGSASDIRNILKGRRSNPEEHYRIYMIQS